MAKAYSTALRMAYLRAREFREQARSRHFAAEHVFLGLLKLSGERASDMLVGAPAELLEAADREIRALREQLIAREIRVDTALPKLTRLIGGGGTVDAVALTYWERQADQNTTGDEISAAEMLYTALQNPTDLMRLACPKLQASPGLRQYRQDADAREAERLARAERESRDARRAQKEKEEGRGKEAEERKPAPPAQPADEKPAPRAPAAEPAAQATGKTAEEAAPQHKGEPIKRAREGLAPLSDLTEQMRSLRGRLLSQVRGQDHAVSAFVDGLFGAQVLADVDRQRRGPRAAFVFAGPPGVGKTFLAETAAGILMLPYRKFDMSDYGEHQAFEALIGTDKLFSGSHEGILTGYVKENPQCVLLFDEIERAHRTTIQLFLQILDAGFLEDRNTNEKVSFRDAVIIFTTNAGRKLYEDSDRVNFAGLHRAVILDAIGAEIQPETKEKVFPAGILSRMASGIPIMFNHLEVRHLLRICADELRGNCAHYKEKYGLDIGFDETMLPTALLLREGGETDARAFKAQSRAFLNSEIFKFCRLWGRDTAEEALSEMERLRFVVETDGMPEDIRSLFIGTERPEILLFAEERFAERCRAAMPELTIYSTQDTEEALNLLGGKDVRLALIDVAMKGDGEAEPEGAGGFDYAPMASGAVREGARLFRNMHERLPELPVYLLEMQGFSIDPELEASFLGAGVRGKLDASDGDPEGLREQLRLIAQELHMQTAVRRLAREHKVLSFDTAPMLSPEKGEAGISLRDFSVRRAVTADDAGSILDDIEKPATRFSDVIGAEDAKDEFKEYIRYLKNPKRYTAEGKTPPKGVLLYGPPGTGKTMLARALAGETNVTFVPSNGTSFVTVWQGSGPDSVRKLFAKARRYAPAILFIDEIDAIGRKRGTPSSGHGEEMALEALLAEMDGFAVDPRRPVFVIGATNAAPAEGGEGVGVLDPALARRFERRIFVDLPNEAERDQVLAMYLKKVPGAEVTDEMRKQLARRSIGLSPAILEGVVRAAQRLASRRDRPLEDAALDEAFETEMFGEKKDWGEETLERVARHEAGHALISSLAGEKPAYLTIVARSDHGGYMARGEGATRPIYTKREELAHIRTALGGRAAEIVCYGEEEGISTGASSDLASATATAVRMLTQCGMDVETGLASERAGTPMSDALRARVNALLAEEMQKAVAEIRDNRDKLDRLAEALLRRNKLTGAEIEAVLAGEETGP